MKYYKISFILLFALSLFGCEDYVNIKTQGSLIPEDVKNYRYLLNNTSVLENGPQITDIASDDVQLVDSTYQISGLSSSDYYAWYLKTYTWQTDIYPIGYYQTDYNWSCMYNTITYANTVITEVPSSTGGNDSTKTELMAEALVHRADAYLMLVNMYAKPYNASTASSDLGVPLVLTETTTQALTRQSVQEVYNRVIADLV
mgnify:CR=1 FL=1